MNGDVNEPEELEQVEEGSEEPESSSDTEVVLDVDDGMGIESTVEIKVDKLVAKLDKTDAAEAAKKAAVRKQLEKAREEQDAGLDGTYNFNLDEDL